MAGDTTTDEITLQQAAHQFLSSLKQGAKGNSPEEVLKFVRWLGPDRTLTSIRGHEVASYGEMIAPSMSDATQRAEVVRAFLKVLEHAGEERVFNIGSGTGISLNRLVDEIAGVVGARPAVDYTPARRFDVPANVLDASLARRVLGWQATTPLGEGLRRAWEWVRRSGL